MRSSCNMIAVCGAASLCVLMTPGCAIEELAEESAPLGVEQQHMILGGGCVTASFSLYRGVYDASNCFDLTECNEEYQFVHILQDTDLTVHKISTQNPVFSYDYIQQSASVRNDIHFSDGPGGCADVLLAHVIQTLPAPLDCAITPEEPACAITPGSCGGSTCPSGTYCCNPSCGICVPKGYSCTQQACN